MKALFSTLVVAALAATAFSAPIPRAQQPAPLPMLPPPHLPADPPPPPPIPDPLPSDIAEAWMHLTAPPEAPVNIPEDRWARVSRAVHWVCRGEQVINKYEESYVFVRYGDRNSDIDVLRHRLVEFADCPKIEAADGFPDVKTIEMLLAFNYEFRRYVEARIPWEADRADILNATLKETDQLRRCWSCLRDARVDWQQLTARRQHLRDLKKLLTEIIGPQAFDERQMPDFVPIWRFVPCGRDGQPLNQNR